jgi:hypothetical protein
MSDARPTYYDLLMSIKPDNLTPNAWLSRAGVNRSWWGDLRNGTVPKVDTLEKVLRAIDWTPAQFEDLKGSVGLRSQATGAPAPVLPFRGRNEPMDLPHYGTAQGSDLEVAEDGAIQFIERMDLDLGNVVEYLRRPPALAGRDDVYAISVIGNSVAPRYEDGDPAYVEARRQPRPGDYVVVQLLRRDDEDGDAKLHIALLKQLVRKTSTYVELAQSNPPLNFTIPLTEVHAIHRVKPWREIVFF